MSHSGTRIFSIRYKLSLLSFATCFIVLLLIKIISPMLITRDFINRAKEQHYNNFSENITNYYENGGELETIAGRKEFTRSLQKERQQPPPNRNPQQLPNQDPNNQQQPAQGGNTPLDRFGITNREGISLVVFREYKPGSTVSDAELNKGKPIRYNNEIVAYVISDGTISIPLESQDIYNSMNRILNYTLLLALVVAMVIGLTVGNRMTRSIRELTKAADSISKGASGQQVTEIKSRDEIEILANVLNRMSIDLEKKHKEIKALAITDELTGLYNRRFFNEQVKVLLPNSFRDKQSISIVLGDIDFFKKVNDNFSHLVGDEVLKLVSKIITDGLREGDIVARFGGEEIIMALHDAGREKAIAIIERIRVSIENYPWDTIAPELSITMSFGISTETIPTNYHKIIEKADELLYKAKDNGRNRVEAV